MRAGRIAQARNAAKSRSIRRQTLICDSPGCMVTRRSSRWRPCQQRRLASLGKHW